MQPVRKDEADMPHMNSQSSLLMRVLRQIYTAIFMVNLEEDTAVCLFANDQSLLHQDYPSWEQFFRDYSRMITDSRRTRARNTFSCAGMKAQYAAGKRTISFTYPCDSPGDMEDLMITAVYEEHGGVHGQHACVLFHRLGQENLLRRIVDLYVYDNCDYFIYLDAKTDSYITFGSAATSTPLPPATAQNYSEEIITYARKYVVPEDQDRVIQAMEISYVIEQLAHQEIYSFTAGVLDPVRGYTRKKLDYRYYDKENKLILLCRTDITDLYLEQQRQVQALQEALEQARTDALTGLLNYQGIVYYVKEYLASTAAQGALIFLDLDNFKSVNDTYGHQAGDMTLQYVAKTLQAIVPESNYVSRIGGDEFVVFLKHVDTLEDAISYGKAICENVAKLSGAQHECQHMSCSVGIAMMPQDGTTYEDLIKSADDLAYESKKKGKNQYSYRQAIPQP